MIPIELTKLLDQIEDAISSEVAWDIADEMHYWTDNVSGRSYSRIDAERMGSIHEAIEEWLELRYEDGG